MSYPNECDPDRQQDRRGKLRLHTLLSVTLPLTLAACGGGGGGTPQTDVIVTAPTPTPPPPPPTTPPPPPPPAASFVGAVYTSTNSAGQFGNFVAGFGRNADGTLVPIDSYFTGGVGQASLSPIPPRPNALIAEDSIIAADDRFLLVVNAGSNDVSCLRINSDFSLTETDTEASGGTSPISLAYRNGIVYVANADEDGIFTAPENQSGNVTAMRLDAATGQLTRLEASNGLAEFSLSLRGRPADLEISPDGTYLIISSVNAGSPQLPQPTAAEVSSFRIEPDGTLASAPAGTGMSTQLNNAEGRHLPNAIGIETFAQNGRQFLIAAEARMDSSTGVPSTTFAAFQTGSVSTWEISASGALVPRTQDFLLGPSTTSGPTQASFVAYSPAFGIASIASSTGGAITSILFDADGHVELATGGYQIQGFGADPTSPHPLANADGLVDLAFSPAGDVLYQLVGLKGRIDVYQIVLSYELRQQLTTGLQSMDNVQGLVVVGPRP